MTTGPYYRLAPGIDIVPLGDGGVLLRSDVVVLRLEGVSAEVLTKSVLPHLDGRSSLEAVLERLPGISIDDLRIHLDQLVEAHVLIRSESSLEADPDMSRPLWGLLETLGVPAVKARRRLDDLTVALFGLQGHGAHLAVHLARLGVGRLYLVDPYPCEPSDAPLWPTIAPQVVGQPRQVAVAEALRKAGLSTRVSFLPQDRLDRSGVRAIAEEANLLVGCFDRGFGAAHLWINRLALERGVPALFGELRGHKVLAGPLVLPGETACLLCWRMRSIACEDDFRDAMGYEEFLDGQREPQLHRRAVLPPCAAHLAATLALEILKTVLAIGKLTLTNAVHEFDGLVGSLRYHHFLQRPDCPACSPRSSGETVPPNPPLDGLTHSSNSGGEIRRAAAHLVSARCGVIRSVSMVTKDPSEPELPHVMRAELANHRFLHDREAAFIVCSGKGFNREEAEAGALGEAVERYAGSVWSQDEQPYCRRTELPGLSLDPRRLVLFHAEQYPALKYAPYVETSSLSWVQGRSLVSGEMVYVPSLAVYMAYEVRRPEEFLFPITSNGLAAGPSLAMATLASALEVLERDAFLIAWHNRLPCRRVNPITHPDFRIVNLCRAYDRRGVLIELYEIPTDHVARIFVALGVSEGTLDGPAAVVGLGAAMDPARAARAAILEVAQVRPALRIRLREPKTRSRLEQLLANPESVESLEDHDLLYASRDRVGSFDFMRKAAVTEADWRASIPLDAESQLRVLAESLGALGSDLIYCNLTSRDIASLGLHVVRTILPDFQPIHFGWRERRLGGDRMFELPQRLGFRSDRASIANLNPDPHPLA